MMLFVNGTQVSPAAGLSPPLTHLIVFPVSVSAVCKSGREDTAMPINRLLANSKLEPEDVERLNCALLHALRSLSLVDRSDPLTEMIAKKIIDRHP